MVTVCPDEQTDGTPKGEGRYELWDSASGNALGAYDTEEAALTAIRDTIEFDGRQAVETFALLRIDFRGRATVIAEGEALAQRALTASSVGPIPSRASVTA